MIEFLLSVIKQANKTLSLASHHPACNFSGCDCGAVEAFKVEYAEFCRMLQKVKQ